MRLKHFIATSMCTALALIFIAGCSPRPPVPYQQLQIQDSEEAQGYDVYLYIAISPRTPDDKVEALLKWFDQVKYPSVDKMRVFAWGNPQSALTNSMGDLIGSLNVDRKNGVYELTVRDSIR